MKKVLKFAFILVALCLPLALAGCWGSNEVELSAQIIMNSTLENIKPNSRFAISLISFGGEENDGQYIAIKKEGTVLSYFYGETENPTEHPDLNNVFAEETFIATTDEWSAIENVLDNIEEFINYEPTDPDSEYNGVFFGLQFQMSMFYENFNAVNYDEVNLVDNTFDITFVNPDEGLDPGTISRAVVELNSNKSLKSIIYYEVSLNENPSASIIFAY